jgi:hypothetical protein
LNERNRHDDDNNPDYDLTKKELRRALVFVEVERSWRSFANNASPEKVPERRSLLWQVISMTSSARADRTEHSECSAQFILRARVKDACHLSPPFEPPAAFLM